MSRRETRVFSGLGPCIFKIDFTKLSKEYGETGGCQDERIIQNEINTDVTIKNTPHHKMIIKARNESYEMFKSRFTVSVQRIMQMYDSDRLEETRFNQYW